MRYVGVETRVRRVGRWFDGGGGDDDGDYDEKVREDDLLGACHENPSLVPGLPIAESELSVGVVSLEALHDEVVQEPIDPKREEGIGDIRSISRIHISGGMRETNLRRPSSFFRGFSTSCRRRPPEDDCSQFLTYCALTLKLARRIAD